MRPVVYFINEHNDDDAIEYSKFVRALIKQFSDRRMELAHNALGISGEAGEYADAIKKHIIYGNELDRKNVKEELGDVLFFVQDAITKFNFTWDEIFQANADKLAKRYVGMKYSDEAAIERADKKEQEIRERKFDFSDEEIPAPVKTYEAVLKFDCNKITPSEWMAGDNIHHYVYAESQEAAENGLHIAGPYKSMNDALQVIPLECNRIWRLNSQTNKFEQKVGGF